VPRSSTSRTRCGQPSWPCGASGRPLRGSTHTAGYSLTLRQLYYQFVAAASPRTGRPDTTLNARISGSGRSSTRPDVRTDRLVHIEDRTRGEHISPHWETPGDIINSARASYSWTNGRSSPSG